VRERLVKERLRLANSDSALHRLHGVSAADPAGKGFGARLDGLDAGYGTELQQGFWPRSTASSTGWSWSARN